MSQVAEVTVTQVVMFRPVDRAIVDGARLAALVRSLGARRAEEHVIEHVEEISDRLARIDYVQRQSIAPEIQTSARQIAALSDAIGLVSLARVSRDLAAAAAQGDAPAYRAVWERLVRIGDRSLAQVWETPALSL